jgi:hypothetical protein
MPYERDSQDRMEIKVHLRYISYIRSLPAKSNFFRDASVPAVTGASWRKSSYSTYNGNCVEIGHLDAKTIAVKDAKHHGRGPVLAFTRDGWSAFLGDVKAGGYDST